MTNYTLDKRKMQKNQEKQGPCKISLGSPKQVLFLVSSAFCQMYCHKESFESSQRGPESWRKESQSQRTKKIYFGLKHGLNDFICVKSYHITHGRDRLNTI